MKIIEKDPNEPDSMKLMDELSDILESITGSNGKNSFNNEDISVPRAIFVIAYNDEGEAIGCGAIRPIDDNVAEVKRMYAKTKAMGVGTEILCYLESKAKLFGYSALRLETRLINERAVSFYKSRGYNIIQNYGKYINRTEAVCFEKLIV